MLEVGGAAPSGLEVGGKAQDWNNGILEWWNGGMME